MTELQYQLKRLLTVFEDNWAYCDALQTLRRIETSGRTAHWETVLQASLIRAREQFLPALSALENGAPVAGVLEELLERLARPQSSPSRD